MTMSRNASGARRARALIRRVGRRVYVSVYGEDARRARVFGRMYKHRMWGRDLASASGSGSDLVQTAAVRAQLPGLLSDFGIRTLVDAPCGDYHWMSAVAMPSSLEMYIGIDIVPELIESLTQRHGDRQHTFLCRD